MRGEPRAIKFYHPGAEWRSEEAEGIAPWGTYPPGHKRKYLETSGRFLTHPQSPIQTGRIGFWGEYEAPTAFRRLAGSPRPEFPTFAHTPVRLDPLDRPRRGALNSDPVVFGPTWFYTNCQQPSKSGLRTLDPGDVILFGSQLHGRFVLDTLFVVAEAVPYHTRTARATLADGVPDWLFTLVLDLVREGEYTLYTGATPEKPVQGRFSYVPCVDAAAHPAGFPRPALPTRYQSLQSQSVAYLNDPPGEVWNQVTRAVLDQGLGLGIFANLPVDMAASQVEALPSRC